MFDARRHQAGMLLVVAGITLLGLGASATAPAHAATRNVVVRNYVFDDATPGDGVVTATVGDVLHFSIEGTAGQKHSINVDELAISSGEKSSGSTFDALATQPGTFSLYCDVKHGSHAHAAQLVVAAPTSGGGATTTTSPSGGGATSTTRPASSTTARPGSGGAPASTTVAPGGGAATGSPSAAAGGAASAGSAPPSTNAAGQLVTAEGEVIAQPEDDDGSDGSGGESAGESAASRLLGAPARAVGGGDAWIGLGGIALLLAGVAVLVMKRPKKAEPDEAQEIVVSDEWDDPEA